MRVLVAVMTLTMLIGAAPANADPALLSRAYGELTFVGSARGQDFWQRVSGIVSFGPDAQVDSDGNIDASGGSGCLSVGTSFANTAFVCAPFLPGEVVLAVNGLEHGAGVLTVNTLARTTGRVLAVVPLLDESPPFISPLSPLFWIPWIDQSVAEEQVHASIRGYEADFFDVQTGFVQVNGQQATMIDGSGIVVADARIAATATP